MPAIKMDRPAPRWASVEEVARYLHSGRKLVYRMVWSGELPASRIGKKMLRIDLNDVDAIMQPVRGDVA